MAVIIPIYVSSFIIKDKVTKIIPSLPRSSLPTPDPDGGLIQNALRGNKKSFEELIQKHQPLIFAMIYRHVRQREEAEDVVQQVFMKAFQHLGNFRGESKFSTWLYTIALNLMRDHTSTGRGK